TRSSFVPDAPNLERLRVLVRIREPFTVGAVAARAMPAAGAPRAVGALGHVAPDEVVRVAGGMTDADHALLFNLSRMQSGHLPLPVCTGVLGCFAQPLRSSSLRSCLSLSNAPARAGALGCTDRASFTADSASERVHSKGARIVCALGCTDCASFR